MVPGIKWSGKSQRKDVSGPGETVQLTFARHPTGNQAQSQPQQVCCMAGERVRVQIRQDLGKGAAGPPLFSLASDREIVLEVDQNNGQAAVQAAVSESAGVYSATLDLTTAGAAAVLVRRLSDGVALTPPTILQVSPGPCSGLMLLSASPGLEVVKAGEVVRVTLVAVDEFANPAGTGGGKSPRSPPPVLARVTSLTPGAQPEDVKVSDGGEPGTYHLQFTVGAAGPFKLDCQLKDIPASKLSLPGTVWVGATDPEQCTLAPHPPSITAGHLLRVGVTRCDHRGNPLGKPDPDTPLTFQVVSGPGPVESYSREGPAVGDVEVCVMARVAGKYVLQLSASSSAQTNQSGGKKINLQVLPGAVSVEMTTATVYHKGAETQAREVNAGELMVIGVDARDQYGNRTKLANPKHSFVVTATGASHQRSFELARAPPKGIPDACTVFSASLTQAGLYRVSVSLSTGSGKDQVSLQGAGARSEAAYSKKSGNFSVASTSRKMSTGSKPSKASASEGLAPLLEADNSTLISGWPQEVQVLSGPGDARQSRLTGTPLTGGVRCWEEETLTLVLHDSYGNPKTSGGDRVTATVSSTGLDKKKEKEKEAVQVVDCGDGSYALRVLLTREGAWQLGLTINGTAMPGPPGQVEGVRLQARHADISPASCTVTGLLESPLVCGVESRIMVQPMQYSQGRRMSGLEAVNVHVTPPSGVRRQLQAVVPPQGGGRFMACFTWTEAGDHTVQVSLGGTPLPSTPVVVAAQAAPASPPHCTLHGQALSGATTWEPNKVILMVKDKFGNVRTAGGDQVEAWLSVPGEKAPRPVEVQGGDGQGGKGGGVFTLAFICVKEGTTDLTVKVNGFVIAEGPRRFPVAAGSVSSMSMTLQLPDTPPVCSQPTTLYLQASQWSSGQVVGKELPVAVTLVAPSGAATVLEPEFLPAEGRFMTRATCVEAGPNKVVARVAGTPLQGNHILQAVPGPAHLPACEVEGEGSRRCVAGVPASFIFRSKDFSGNALQTHLQGLVFEAVSVSSGERMVGTLESQKDQPGVFKCTYTLTLAGPTSLRFTLKGTAATAGELILEGACVPGPTHPPNSQVSEWESEVDVDSAGSMVVVRKDAHHNTLDHLTALPTAPNQTRENPLVVTVRGGVDPHMDTQVTERGDGTVMITYKTKKAGRYWLAVEDSESGEAVQGSPFQVTVLPGPASVAHSTWRLTSAQKGTPGTGEAAVVAAGQAVDVTVEARDRFGNATELAGWCEVAASSGTHHTLLELLETKKQSKRATSAGPQHSSPSGPASSSSSPPGVLQFSGVINSTGSYKLEVSMTVPPEGPDGAASGGGGGMSHLRGSQSMGSRSLAVRGVLGKSTSAGQKSLKSKLNNSDTEAVPGWPALLQVVPAPASAKHSTVVGAALSSPGVHSWEPFKLTLHCLDQFKNECTSGGDKVVAHLNGPKGSAPCKAEVLDNGDGTYTLGCRVKGEGIWTLALWINDRAMADQGPAPHKVTATTSNLSAADTCVVVGSNLQAGATCHIYVQAVEWSAGRPMRGHEAISLRVVAPSGISTSLQPDYDKKTARFMGVMEWVEAGPHLVTAMLEGAAVSGGAKTTTIVPGPVSLTKCKPVDKDGAKDGTGHTKCVAGEEAMFWLQALDLYGNSLKGVDSSVVDMLKLTVAVVGGRNTPGEVKWDSESGMYLCSYMVTTAGQCTLTLSPSSAEKGSRRESGVTGGVGGGGAAAGSSGVDGSESRVFSAVCVPGATSAEHCTTEMPRVEVLVAGELGTFSLRRRDAFANSLERLHPGRDKPMAVKPSHPALTAKAIDLGNGHVEVQYECTQAGSYSLGVFDSGSGAEVAGSPFSVSVTPAGVVPRQCTAQFAQGVLPQPHHPEVMTVVAGEMVGLEVAARDGFDNLTTTLPPHQAFQVKALAPDMPQVELAPGGAGGSGRLQFSGALTQAGVYALSVSLAEKRFAWPASLNDFAPGGAGSNPARSVVGSATGSARGRSGTAGSLRSGAGGAGGGSGGGLTSSSLMRANSKSGGMSSRQSASPARSRTGSVSSEARRTSFGTSSRNPVSPKKLGGGGGGHSRSPSAGSIGAMAGEAAVTPTEAAAVALPSWPRRLLVLPAACDSKHCTIQEAGGRTSGGPVRCWQPVTYTLITADRFGNPCQGGGHKIEVALSRPPAVKLSSGKGSSSSAVARNTSAGLATAGKGPGYSDVQVVDLNDGTYSLTFSLHLEGVWTLMAQVNGETVPVKVSVEAAVDPCSPTECRVFLSSGPSAPEMINPQGVCGLTSTLRIQATEFASAGRLMRGTENLKVFLKHLQGSGGSVESSSSTGPAGSKRGPPGGSKDQAKEQGWEVVPVVANSSLPGTFMAELQWVRAGPHLVTATLDDTQITGSPLTVQVGGGECSARCCVVSGAALNSAVSTWAPTSLLLTTADKFATPCTTGGHVVKASVQWESAPGVSSSGSAGLGSRAGGGSAAKEAAWIKVEVEDNQDGTYTLPLFLKKEGNWALRVTVSGTPVSEAPLRLTAVRAPVPAHDTLLTIWQDVQQVISPGGSGDALAEATAVESCEVVCGAPLQLALRPKRWAQGHHCSGQEGVVVRVIAPSGAVVLPEMTCQLQPAPTSGAAGSLSSLPGLYTGEVQLQEAGRHTITATVDALPVSGGPLKCLVGLPAALSPPHCSVVGLQECEPVVGEAMCLEVIGRDHLGNHCPLDSPSEVSVAVSPNQDMFTVDLKMTSNGRVAVTCTPLTVGSCTVSVYIHHVCILSEVTITVRPGPLSLHNCTVHQQQQSNNLQVTAGEARTVVVAAHDARNHAIHIGGAKLTAAVRVGGAPVQPVEVKDCGDGSYCLSLCLATQGPFTLIMQNGAEKREISGECLAGATSAPACTIRGLSESASGGGAELRVGCGERCKLWIERRDRFGNKVTRHSKQAGALTKFAASLTAKGASPTRVVLEDQADEVSKDGFVQSFEVVLHFSPTAMGNWTLNIWDTTKGEKVGGCPIAVAVVAGPPYAPCCSVQMLKDKDADLPSLPASSSASSSLLPGGSFGRFLNKGSSKGTATPSGSAPGTLHLPAGATLQCQITLRDKFGTLTQMTAENEDGVRLAAEEQQGGESRLFTLTPAAQVKGASKAGPHTAVFEAEMNSMGRYTVKLYTGTESAVLASDRFSDVKVTTGVAASAAFHSLENRTLTEYSTVKIQVECRDAWGNEGATGPAWVSTDVFLTLSSWLAARDTKTRFQLDDPLVTGQKIRTAEVTLPAAGKWKLAIETLDTTESSTGETKYKIMHEQFVDVVDDPSIR